MKKIVLSLFICFFFLSCQQNDNALKQCIKNASKIEVFVYKKSKRGQAPVKVFESIDRKIIDDFVTFFKPQRTKLFKCGYDGKIVISGFECTLEVEYNLSPDCLHAIYTIDGEPQTQQLTSEGIKFLSSLRAETNTIEQ